MATIMSTPIAPTAPTQTRSLYRHRSTTSRKHNPRAASSVPAHRGFYYRILSLPADISSLIEVKDFWTSNPGGGAGHMERELAVAVVGDFYRQRVGGRSLPWYVSLTLTLRIVALAAIPVLLCASNAWVVTSSLKSSPPSHGSFFPTSTAKSTARSTAAAYTVPATARQ